jgi:hypothetical protein
MQAKPEEIKAWIEEARGTVITMQTFIKDPDLRKLLGVMALLTNAVDALAASKE